MKTKHTSSLIVVSFHIGRGSRFYNAGHRTFIGEKNFQDLINMEANNVFVKDRGPDGRFCKPLITDCSGNPVSDDDVNELIGTLDFDGQYDTSYAKIIDDCDEHELQIITEANIYKSPALVAYLMNANPLLVFDEYGILIKNEETER
jgi:hypothetical protein